MVRGSMCAGACARRACQRAVHVCVQCMCVLGWCTMFVYIMGMHGYAFLYNSVSVCSHRSKTFNLWCSVCVCMCVWECVYSVLVHHGYGWVGFVPLANEIPRILNTYIIIVIAVRGRVLME